MSYDCTATQVDTGAERLLRIKNDIDHWEQQTKEEHDTLLCSTPSQKHGVVRFSSAKQKEHLNRLHIRIYGLPDEKGTLFQVNSNFLKMPALEQVDEAQYSEFAD